MPSKRYHHYIKFHYFPDHLRTHLQVGISYCIVTVISYRWQVIEMRSISERCRIVGEYCAKETDRREWKSRQQHLIWTERPFWEECLWTVLDLAKCRRKSFTFSQSLNVITADRFGCFWYLLISLVCSGVVPRSYKLSSDNSLIFFLFFFIYFWFCCLLIVSATLSRESNNRDFSNNLLVYSYVYRLLHDIFDRVNGGFVVNIRVPCQMYC